MNNEERRSEVLQILVGASLVLLGNSFMTNVCMNTILEYGTIMETVVSITFMQMEVVGDISTLYILRQIRCAAVVEGDSKWIWEPTNKLGTRQLRIVTRTPEMDRWIKIKIRVRFIIGISVHMFKL